MQQQAKKILSALADFRDSLTQDMEAGAKRPQFTQKQLEYTRTVIDVTPNTQQGIQMQKDSILHKYDPPLVEKWASEQGLKPEQVGDFIGPNIESMKKEKDNIDIFSLIKEKTNNIEDLPKITCDRHTTLGEFIREDLNDVYQEYQKKINVKIFVNGIPIAYNFITEHELDVGDEISFEPATLGLSSKIDDLIKGIKDYLKNNIGRGWEKSLSKLEYNRELVYFYYSKLEGKPIPKDNWLPENDFISDNIGHAVILTNELLRILKKGIPNISFKDLFNRDKDTRILTPALKSQLKEMFNERQFDFSEDSLGRYYGDSWYFIMNNDAFDGIRGEVLKELDFLFEAQFKIHVDSWHPASHPLYFEVMKYYFKLRAILFNEVDGFGYYTGRFEAETGIYAGNFRDGMRKSDYKVRIKDIEQNHRVNLRNLVEKDIYLKFVGPVINEFIEKCIIYNGRRWLYRFDTYRAKLIESLIDFDKGKSIISKLSKYALNELLFDGIMHVKEGAGDRFALVGFIRSMGEGYSGAIESLEKNIIDLSIDDFKNIGYIITQNELDNYKTYAEEVFMNWKAGLNLIPKILKYEGPPRKFTNLPKTFKEMRKNPDVLIQWFEECFAPPSASLEKVLGWHRDVYKYFMREFLLRQTLRTCRYTGIPLTDTMVNPVEGGELLHLNHENMFEPNSLDISDIMITTNIIAKLFGEKLSYDSQKKIDELMDNLLEKKRLID